jgi:hypothetical protein
MQSARLSREGSAGGNKLLLNDVGIRDSAVAARIWGCHRLLTVAFDEVWAQESAAGWDEVLLRDEMACADVWRKSALPELCSSIKMRNSFIRPFYGGKLERIVTRRFERIGRSLGLRVLIMLGGTKEGSCFMKRIHSFVIHIG